MFHFWLMYLSWHLHPVHRLIISKLTLINFLFTVYFVPSKVLWQRFHSRFIRELCLNYGDLPSSSFSLPMRDESSIQWFSILEYIFFAIAYLCKLKMVDRLLRSDSSSLIKFISSIWWEIKILILASASECAVVVTHEKIGITTPISTWSAWCAIFIVAKSALL